MRRSAADWLAAVEAGLWLVAALILRRLLPFSALTAIASRRTRSPVSCAARRAQRMQQVAWAVRAMAHRLPWSAACFDQAIAAQAMLRWRGVPSTMVFGAGWNCSRDLQAHVWVKVGSQAVVGGELAADFTAMASFPPTTLER